MHDILQKVNLASTTRLHTENGIFLSELEMAHVSQRTLGKLARPSIQIYRLIDTSIVCTDKEMCFISEFEVPELGIVPVGRRTSPVKHASTVSIQLLLHPGGRRCQLF